MARTMLLNLSMLSLASGMRVTSAVRSARSETSMKKAHSNALAAMPQMCFGAGNDVPAELTSNVAAAITAGYRHIDTAVNYANFMDTPAQYWAALRDGIHQGLAANGLKREDLWITFKGNGDQLKQTPMIVRGLGIGYVDIVMVHHGYKHKESCSSSDERQTIKGLLSGKVALRWGISDCYDLDAFRTLREAADDKVAIKGHPIQGLQIQAAPRGQNNVRYNLWGKSCVQRGVESEDVVAAANGLGIPVMLFSMVSLNFGGKRGQAIDVKIREKAVEFYMQEYIVHSNPGNVAIVGSQSGSTIAPNMELFSRMSQMTSQALRAQKAGKPYQEVQKRLWELTQNGDEGAPRC